jgi:hypothetical protein
VPLLVGRSTVAASFLKQGAQCLRVEGVSCRDVSLSLRELSHDGFVSQDVKRLLKRLQIIHRHHDHNWLAVLRDRDALVSVLNAVDHGAEMRFHGSKRLSTHDYYSSHS